MRPFLLALAPVALTAVALAACSPSTSKPSAQSTEPTKPKFDTTLSMAEVMGHVINPASFAFWKGSGTEITAKGERDLSPTTDEGWETLENGAAVLIEAGNALQLPGRVQAPVADWTRYAQALTGRAIEAKAAAEKHDKGAAFRTGAALYETCVACHAKFVIEPGLKANPPLDMPFPANAATGS